MRAYRDWSGVGEPVWELTEPAIYYQAAYVRLLAELLASG
jgi:endoglucanase